MDVAVDGLVAERRISPKEKVKGYISLTKPRVMELLLVTTFPVMILAERGIPDLWLVFATLVGGALSAGSASAFNCYIDRDIDRLMNRTSKRPLVTGVLSDREALVFSWTTGVVAILWLALTTNLLAAGLALVAILIYVLLYTLVLKRRTPQNIVWGGTAGCMPVLIGWAAVTNSLSWEALILFGIIFLWTPPHYWPLSMKYRDDYKTAGVPMLAVVRGRVVVGLQIVLYAWAMVACSLLLIPVGHMGLIYSVTAIAAGAWFLYESHRLYSRSIRDLTIKPMRVFHGSITYLTLVFLAVAIDPLVTIFPL
ncbi:heme o synthase [Herbiconiux liangxiaofengii]|uniref:heme o synthase n=1 Tax=Herbiconiux liangxiaofengii TaxID=3342795 RepID=UPI0035BB4FAB